MFDNCEEAFIKALVIVLKPQALSRAVTGVIVATDGTCVIGVTDGIGVTAGTPRVRFRLQVGRHGHAHVLHSAGQRAGDAVTAVTAVTAATAGTAATAVTAVTAVTACSLSGKATCGRRRHRREHG